MRNATRNNPIQARLLAGALVLALSIGATSITGSAALGSPRPLSVNSPTANIVKVVKLVSGKYRLNLDLADVQAGKTVKIRAIKPVNGVNAFFTLGQVVLKSKGKASLTFTTSIPVGATIIVRSGTTKLYTTIVNEVIDKLAASQAALDILIASATTLVTSYESSGTDAAKTAAQTAVNLLPAGAIKTALQARMTVKNAAIATLVTSATRLVAAYESSGTDVAKTAADTAVSALPTGTAKTDLQTRMTTKQTAVLALVESATTKVTQYETGGTEALKTLAQDAVTGLPTGAAKTALQTRITTKTTSVTASVTAATALVVTYEGSGSDATKTAAQTAVTALPTGTAKTALQTRITTKTTSVTSSVTAATTLVATYESTGTDGAKTAAQTAVTALPTGTAKTALQARIDTKAATAATALVVTYEGSGTDGDKTAAQTAVTALSAGATKTALQERIDAKTAAVSAATLVATYESTGSDAAKTAAQTAVTALPAGSTKTGLQTRIDDKTTAVAADVTAAAALVTTYEGSGSDATKTAAQSAVTALPTGTAKTGLQTRISDKTTAVATAVTAATALVATYEVSADPTDGSAAQAAVDALPDVAAKATLQLRIDAV